MNLKCWVKEARLKRLRSVRFRLPNILAQAKLCGQTQVRDCQVYPFPRATVTKYYKLGSLKQPKFTLLPFQSQKSEVKLSGGPHSLHRPQDSSWCLPLPASGGLRHPLACGHTTPISAPVVMWPSLHMCLSLISTLVMAFRAHLDNPVIFISKSLI